jgi:hypothetical protein
MPSLSAAFPPVMVPRPELGLLPVREPSAQDSSPA